MGKIKPQALLLQSKKKKGPSGNGLTTVITCNVVVILIVLSLYGTYKHWHGLRYQRSSNQLATEFFSFLQFETIQVFQYFCVALVAFQTSNTGLLFLSSVVLM